jgi:hypothetical protein
VWRSAPEQPLGALGLSAPGRGRMASTGRATCWARPVQAGPGPWFFSTRAQECWATGWSRRTRLAAWEQTHVRDALPSLAPEVPQRLPAEACAPVTRRHEARPAWPLGTRWRAGMASNRPRRRLGADSRARAPQRKRVGRLRLGHVAQGQRQGAPPRGVVAEALAGDRKAFGPGGGGEPASLLRPVTTSKFGTLV